MNSGVRVTWIIPVAFVFGSFCGVQGQTCSSATTPTLNGQKWAVPSINSLVYIDPSLPAAVQSAISTAVANFQSGTGEPVFVAPAGAPVPDPTTANSQGAIYMNNTSSGSPSAIAHTATTLKYVNGVATNQQINAVTSFNLSFMLASNVPAYSATQPNASIFIQEVVMNELGHAFGLNDIPAAGANNDDYSQQTPGASIMNGYVNTNDQGPHTNPAGGADLPGGVGSGGKVSPCDKKQVQTATSTSSGGGGSGGGGGGGTPTCPNPLENCGSGGDKPY